MKKYTIIGLTFLCSTLFGQVGINTNGSAPHPSAGLDVDFTNKGVLIPRMTQAQRNAIASPATSLLIYQTDNTPGFYYYDGTSWVLLGGSGGSGNYVAGTGISISGNVISNTGVTASCGTTNYIPKASSSTTLTCSQLYDNGTNVGIGTTNPSQKLHVNGNFLFTGSLMPNGNAGNSGQVLVSQGANNPPIWITPNLYGSNASSTKLTTYVYNSNQSNWTTLLTLNITPNHNTIYIFSSFSTRLEDNNGNAQFGQASVLARILVNNTVVARAATVITDFDDDGQGGWYISTSGTISFSGIPVSVTPGVPTTVTLQWRPAVSWAGTTQNPHWRLGIDPNDPTIGDHAVLTVFD